MPRSRAICACDLPLLCTKCTASSLNSFVKVRNSFGMMSSPERLSSKFILSEKVRQAQKSAQWILEGDIAGCFDAISHEWLLAHIPMEKAILKKWLKAGYMEQQTLYPTEAGTPQG